MPADFAVLTTPIGDDPAAVLAQPSSLASFWAAFRENKGAVFGLAVFGVIVFLALTANVVAPHSPIEQFRDAVRAPPVWQAGGSWRFPRGTDGDGHDTLSRLIFGARVSLFIGLSVMCVSFIVGVALGLAAAMGGPILDVVITRLMDLIMAVPSLVLAVLVVAVLGPSLANTIIAVTIVYLPQYVRLTRASALGELSKDYVIAARVAGVGPLRSGAKPRHHHHRGDHRLPAAIRASDARFGARRAEQGLRDRGARGRRRAAQIGGKASPPPSSR